MNLFQSQLFLENMNAHGFVKRDFKILSFISNYGHKLDSQSAFKILEQSKSKNCLTSSNSKILNFLIVITGIQTISSKT